MCNNSDGSATADPFPHRPCRFARLGPYLALAAIVLALYGTRLTAMPLRGEEPRRGQIAVEMGWWNDWIVPRQQGSPLLSRPPLQNWLIGAVGYLRGGVDDLAIRLPSVLAILGTTLLIFAYSRTFLSARSAFAAAIAFATMGQVLELGRLGETEAPFTFLLSGSLLSWHAGYVRNAPWTWPVAYCFVAMGTLAKGLQAPVYFAAAIGFYLLIDLWLKHRSIGQTARSLCREVVRPGHLLGLAVFFAIWGAWQIPFFLRLDWKSTLAIYQGDVAMRFTDCGASKILRHLANYPFAILVATLPWSLLLFAYLSPRFRRRIGPARRHVLFLVCALAVTFPSCWFVPNARTRYFMPLYPCFAPLIGLVVERGRKWSANYFTGMAVAIGATAALVAAAVWIDLPELLRNPMFAFRQPLWFAVLYVSACLALAISARRFRFSILPGLLTMIAFAALTWDGVEVNRQLALSQPSPADAIAELKQKIPAGATLYSFGYADWLFAYHYGKPIPRLPWPKPGTPVDPAVDYFCYGNDLPPPSPFRLPYRPIAEINCDRYKSPQPQRVVVVGQLKKKDRTTDFHTSLTPNPSIDRSIRGIQ